jgi:hypothetical protein
MPIAIIIQSPPHHEFPEDQANERGHQFAENGLSEDLKETKWLQVRKY